MKHPLTITLALLTLTFYLLELVQDGSPVLSFSLPVCYYLKAPLPHFLLFHFFHVNIFHLLANLLALWYFKPRATTILVAYLISTFAAYIDTLIIPTSTCGLSAFLFAAFARNYVAWKRNIWTPIILIFITGIIPTVNWHIHLLSFLLSYAVWFPIYAYKTHSPHSPHKTCHP